MTKTYFVVAFCILSASSVFAQSQKSQKGDKKHLPAGSRAYATPPMGVDGVSLPDSFCVSIGRLISDAAVNFIHVRGGEQQDAGSGIVYNVNKGLLGTTTSEIINEPGWRYEGVVYRGSSFEAMQHKWNDYQWLLESCLPSRGFVRSMEKNSSPELEAYQDIRYTGSGKEGASVVSLNVVRSEINGIYTITVSVKK